MRHTKNTAASQEQSSASRSMSEREMLEALFAFVRRHRNLIVGTAGAFALLGLLYLLVAAPSFTATTTMLVDGRGLAQFYQQSPNAIDTTAVQSQVAIIQSEDVARRIVTDFGLVKDREFTHESTLTRLVGAINSLFGRPSLDADLEPYRRAIRSFSRRLTAKAVPSSRAVSISFSSGSPERAAQIANAVAEATIAAQLDARSQVAVAASHWLHDRLAELHREADVAERAVADFKGRSDIGSQAELLKLESSARAYRSEYDNLLRRNLEWTEQQQVPLAEARIISRASPQFETASPNPPLFLGLATAVGAVVGFGLALLRQISDRTLRTRGGVEAAFDADCIALIPTIGARPTWRSRLTERMPPAWAEWIARRLPAKLGAQALQRMPSGVAASMKPVAEWLARKPIAPLSADSVRAIRFGGGSSELTRSNKIIGVVSALPGEGRTTVALALGHLLARTGQRTILLDCDFRNFQLSRMVFPQQSGGALDVLTGGGTLEEAAWTDATTGLRVMPATIAATARDELRLDSPSMRQLLDRLRAEYDAVLLDVPPLAPMNEAEVGPDLVDGYILVIEWGRTHVRVVESALAVSHGVQQSLLGVVLNKVDLRLLGRHDPHFAQYHDRSGGVRERASA